MKTMKSYRLSEITVSHVLSMSKQLDISHADLIAQLVELGKQYFDAIANNDIDTCVPVVSNNFVSRWSELYKMNCDKLDKEISKSFKNTSVNSKKKTSFKNVESDNFDDNSISPNFRDYSDF